MPDHQDLPLAATNPLFADQASDAASQQTAADQAAATRGAPAPKSPSQVAATTQAAGGRPEIYEFRFLPDRDKLVEQQGGSDDTEEAVRLALAWLAANQGADGSWDSSLHRGGRELRIDGQNRASAGSQADTGITGLALLAFLGAGQTHLEGEHRETVRRGLTYLLKTQAADGSLGGNAGTYAFMYCHGMASFALSEAFAVTSDDRLRPAVERAVAYTVRSQHPTTGGWRYRPHDLGDTSQLGWQVMALKSAEMAGISIDRRVWDGAIRFLKSVGSGQHGGRASYRPGEKVTTAMTAEALVCRQFLGMRRENPASSEAGNYLLLDLPGADGRMNLYYWYYGTLGMFQLGDEHWERWNAALKKQLLAAQAKQGSEEAGSWPVDTVWGGYGGRVYTTAMGALCLQVYYRYLPLYARTLPQDGAPK